MRFRKYHGLGNDYVVLDPAEVGRCPSAEQIKLICHRNCGVGSDGILFGPITDSAGRIEVKIFNPDGSEAEKSGNGLRIFARYLWDIGRVKGEPFDVLTAGGTVRCQVMSEGAEVTVHMGRVSFHSRDIPVTGEPREVLNEQIEVLGRAFEYCAATIGNPHCVLLCDDVCEELPRRYGPAIETDSRFPNRTNVQFMRVLDRSNIQIEIWERGAGYTLGSGSSSSAAAAVAHRLGLTDRQVAVHMPGGELDIRIDEDYSITLSGPVAAVFSGDWPA